jgi:hypothetical protein
MFRRRANPGWVLRGTDPPAPPAVVLALAAVLLAAVPWIAFAAPAEEAAPPEAPRAADGAGPGAGEAGAPPGARVFLPQRIPAAAGWVLLLLAIPPLFWGWKIIRYTKAVFFGMTAALVAYELVSPRGGMGWGGAAAGGAVVVGALVGWHIRKLFAALEGACVIGFVFALPGLLLQHELLTFGLGLVGVALGLALGWRAAFYLDAIDSALAGGFLAGLGAMAATQDRGKDVSLLIGTAVLVLSALAGIVVQFKSVSRSQNARS